MYDPSSSANINEATIDHFSLNWLIEFSKSQISGSVTLSIRIIKSTDQIILDSRSLEIISIKSNDEIVSYRVENADILGEKIIISIGKRKDGDKLREMLSIAIFKIRTNSYEKETLFIQSMSKYTCPFDSTMHGYTFC